MIGRRLPLFLTFIALALCGASRGTAILLCSDCTCSTSCSATCYDDFGASTCGNGGVCSGGFACGCSCPYQATSSLWGELKQNTCGNLESNLHSNLTSWANGQCGACGACFYSYTTQYPSCTITSDGFYTQAATLAYACGF